MEVGPVRLRKRRVGRVADQDVPELERARRRSIRRPRAPRAPCRTSASRWIGNGVALRLRRQLDHGGLIEDPADHRGALGDGANVRGEPIEAGAEQCVDRWRDPNALEILPSRPTRRPRGAARPSSMSMPTSSSAKSGFPSAASSSRCRSESDRSASGRSAARSWTAGLGRQPLEDERRRRRDDGSHAGRRSSEIRPGARDQQDRASRDCARRCRRSGRGGSVRPSGRPRRRRPAGGPLASGLEQPPDRREELVLRRLAGVQPDELGDPLGDETSVRSVAEDAVEPGAGDLGVVGVVDPGARPDDLGHAASR